MKNIILVISLFVCGYANAYQKEDFEKKYNQLSKAMDDSIINSIAFSSSDKSQSTNLVCISVLDQINFVNYIIDNYSDYTEMLEKVEMISPPKDEFEEMKISHLSEIEEYKKALAGTKYNCTPE
ncbi:hypothetical protein ASC84_12390 [Acinetobacter sp. Root1280]|uniref:hypothetical protein n=1 Tax=Acinetobacter sp. Root1280 TaxID=1736444 RepID=UPI0006F911D0|nr:hypothetical protein [Acinetobacter sp. Root1280]KQW88170.1 hypothetical protein ASC84_12390 [Acinetobacter sp. Root1280]